jgi:hypothetical protein
LPPCYVVNYKSNNFIRIDFYTKGKISRVTYKFNGSTSLEVARRVDTFAIVSIKSYVLEDGQTSLVVLCSAFLTTNHEVPGSIPGSIMGRIPMVTMVWVVSRIWV